MAPHKSARRLVVAGGLAVAMLIAPGLGALAGPDEHVIAGPSTCTMTKSGSSTSLVCLPGATPGGGGAPTQEEITIKNAQRAQRGLLGLS